MDMCSDNEVVQVSKRNSESDSGSEQASCYSDKDFGSAFARVGKSACYIYTGHVSYALIKFF